MTTCWRSWSADKVPIPFSNIVIDVGGVVEDVDSFETMITNGCGRHNMVCLCMKEQEKNSPYMSGFEIDLHNYQIMQGYSCLFDSSSHKAIRAPSDDKSCEGKWAKFLQEQKSCKTWTAALNKFTARYINI